jgi:hypothetical protein
MARQHERSWSRRSLKSRLTDLFEEAGRKHHQAFLETDGAGPEWEPVYEPGRASCRQGIAWKVRPSGEAVLELWDSRQTESTTPAILSGQG